MDDGMRRRIEKEEERGGVHMIYLVFPDTR